jgi:L-alanine-DL-glutamate epimerase-like enolase superfamily enzyme
MKIRSVLARWLHVPIPPAGQHRSDFGLTTSFDAVLVRIETQSGIVGHGEAKSHVGSASDNRALAVLINDELAPQLVGQDARDITRLWEGIYNGTRAHYALSRGHAFPILGRRGLTLSAISGIDCALWDILGQSLGVPVWRLLGGRAHDSLPAYASGGWAPADRIGEQLLGYIAKGGFKAVKMRVGVADGEARHSAARVRAARAALGPDIDLMVDAHGTMGVAEAKRFCRLVEDCDLAWFEEPVSGDDKRGMAEVRAATDIPIAAGENESTRFDFNELALHRAVDIFQPDLAICGGITEALRIAALADAWQLRLAPHLWGGAPMFAAGLHLCIASPSAIILEYSLGANPLLFELAETAFKLVDGRIAAPEAPGLGLAINEDFVARYAVG